jgi:3-oxoacyl-[acyl-carrier protein] reductase
MNVNALWTSALAMKGKAWPHDSGTSDRELRGRDITVNAIAPGPTATDLFLKGKSAELVDRQAKLAPLERLGQPEDIARVVSFLASADAGWVNGQTLRANGGVI